jgi:xylanolytic transcriptional activator XlnR
MVPPISTAPVATFMDPTPLNGARTHIQLATILDPSSEVRILPRNQESVSQMPQLSSVRSHEEVLIDGAGAAFLSPTSTLPPGRPNVMGDQAPSFSTAEALARPPRSSFSDRSATEEKRANSLYSLYKAPSAECRHRFLQPILPYIRDIIPASVACDLLDVYLTEPGSSLFRVASPYILTRIFRKKSIIDPVNPRPTTPALLATLLWCAVQTADIVLLHVPGSRSKITNALYELSTSLVSERDPDRWRRIHGGLTTENEQAPHQFSYGSAIPATTATNEPGGLIDDVLTFILLAIAVSGGDFKSDCVKWWNKAVRLAIALRLNREDERCSDDVQPCANPICSCKRDQDGQNMTNSEAREERRRVFWLIYCLDRHLALSYNSVLLMPDSYCEVFGKLMTPLPSTLLPTS